MRSNFIQKYYEGLGSIIYGSASGGGGNTPPVTGSALNYGWVVGGASNFGDIPGSPSPPVAGAVLTDAGLAGQQVLVFRGGTAQSSYAPGNGNSYFTKVLASSTVTFFPPTADDEEIIVETIP